MPSAGPRDDLLGPGLLTSAWRYKWVIAVVTVLAAVAALAHASQQPRVYEATASLLLTDPNRPSVVGDTRPSNVQPFTYTSTQAVVLESTAVRSVADEMLAAPITFDEMEDVAAEPVPDVLMVVVRVRHTDAERAVAIANALPEAYEAVAAVQLRESARQSQEELAAARAELEAALADLDARLAAATQRGAQSEVIALQSERFSISSELADIASSSRRISIDSVLFGNGVEQRESAWLTPQPVSPRPVRDTVLAGLLGLLVASGGAWALNTRRESTDERRGPADVLGGPLLGEIPLLPADEKAALVPIVSAPATGEAEAFRFAAAALTLRLPESGATVLVTSPAERDGKSVTSLNLALALAETGRRVVLVDASRRGEGLRPLLGALPSGVFGSPGKEGPSYRWDPQDRDLRLRVLGIPAETDEMAGTAAVLANVNRSADLVLVDAPALFAVAAVTELAGAVDAVLVVLSAHPPESAVQETRLQLDLAGTPVVGYVRNRVRASARPRPPAPGADEVGEQDEASVWSRRETGARVGRAAPLRVRGRAGGAHLSGA